MKGIKFPKTIGEWLSAVELIGADIIVWVDGENEDNGPLWEGSAYDFPLRLADLKLCYEMDCEKPIEFRSSLGEDHNDRPGFVITVKDE